MPGDEHNEDEWLDYSGLNQREKLRLRKARNRLRRRRRSGAPPLFAAILLIAAGFLLFLNSMGVLHIRDIWEFWPLIFVWIGVGRLFCDRAPAGRAVGLLFIGAGALALLFTLHILNVKLHDGTWPLALLCIVFGFGMLIHALERNATAQQAKESPAPGGASTDSSNDETILGAAILGQVKRKLDSESFDGGTIINFMGNVEIDLRRAHIISAARSATVEVKTICGAIKVRIPETWRLDLQGSSILGQFEDRTIPPNIGRDAPSLVITGYSALSSVEIEN